MSKTKQKEGSKVTRNKEMKSKRAAVQSERLRRVESVQKEESQIVQNKTKRFRKIRKFTEDYIRRSAALKRLQDVLLTGQKVVEEKTESGTVGALVPYTTEEVSLMKKQIQVLEERLK